MFDQLLPRRVDNAYRGHKLALWMFGLLVFMKTSIGIGTIVNGRNAATSADGIPLDSFGPAGAQAFVSLFAAWGLAQVTIGMPIARTGDAPGYFINLALVGLMVVGLVLSLRKQDAAAALR